MYTSNVTGKQGYVKLVLFTEKNPNYCSNANHSNSLIE